MDRFKETIKSQMFELGFLDTSTSYCTIPFYFYYKNEDNDSQFMPSALLKDSFFSALQEFPILAGRLHMKNGGIGASIRVGESDINMPEYCEINSNVHFDELEAENFSWDALPKEISQPGFVMRKGEDGIIKLATIKIARLDNNSGLVLLANIAHVVMDTSGVTTFLKRWAQLCRQQTHKTSDVDSVISRKLLWHDRKYLYDSLPEQGEPLDHVTGMINRTKSTISTFFARLSPEARSKVMGFTVSFFPADSHMFRLPFQKLRALKAAILASSTSDCHHMSDNDVITALLSMVVIQCNKGHHSIAAEEPKSSSLFGCFKSSKSNSKNKSKSSNDEQRLVTIAVDCRYRLGQPDMARYTGNGIISHVLAFPLHDIRAEIKPESLARCALLVRQGVNSITPQYIREYVNLGDSAPDCFQRLMAYMIHVPTRFCVSSQARLDFYGADFGNGRPVWVSPPKTYVPGYSSVLPAPASCEYYNIYVSVRGDIMAKVLCHPFWNSLVELIY